MLYVATSDSTSTRSDKGDMDVRSSGHNDISSHISHAESSNLITLKNNNNSAINLDLCFDEEPSYAPSFSYDQCLEPMDLGSSEHHACAALPELAMLSAPRHSFPSPMRSHECGALLSAPMSQADLQKLEKKRERNRIAASKCRQRKLEKIHTLEGQVSRLQMNNDQLSQERDRLLAELHKVKQYLDLHLSQGCVIQHTLLSGTGSGQHSNGLP